MTPWRGVALKDRGHLRRPHCTILPTGVLPVTHRSATPRSGLRDELGRPRHAGCVQVRAASTTQIVGTGPGVELQRDIHRMRALEQ